MNLLHLNSILRKRDDLVSYPDGMTAQEAVQAVNNLIAQAQAEIRPKMPQGATTGQFEDRLHEHLVKQMAAQGFKIVRATQLPQTKQWNHVS